MFYSMMTWLFWRKRQERLSRFVMALMALITLQCLKDIFFLNDYLYTDTHIWTIMTSTDMMAVPLYAFILMELCRPGMVTVRMASAQLLPVIILPVLYIATGREIFYLIEVGYATVYGLAYAVWTIFAIRRYNILLHQQFSYEENINLNWLKVILGFFFMILSLWVLDCLHIDIDAESLYMLGSLVMWMFLAYFIYKHETVISGLKMIAVPSVAPEEDSELALKIKDLFDSRQVYLNPNLKLADIAAMAGTNRTYVSQFFNNKQKTSFFDFVNGYRVRHAMVLLRTSNDKMDLIAGKSGFNSRQSFHRVFARVAGLSPEQFRANNAND